MSAINEVSELYAAYVKGWDAALRRAAMAFEGAQRDAILCHLIAASEDEDTDPPGPWNWADAPTTGFIA